MIRLSFPSNFSTRFNATIGGIVESGYGLFASRKRRVRRLGENFRRAADRRLARIHHRTRDDAAHSALFERTHLFSGKKLPGSANEVMPARRSSSCERRNAHSASSASIFASSGHCRAKGYRSSTNSDRRGRVRAGICPGRGCRTPGHRNRSN